ncbi:hypothetical protein BASA81_005315 [Batrachochytrium salamandrivorans]|nr:hypothetical protein BASA81_005315 [Batrachochytrium salamandrivorans]
MKLKWLTMNARAKGVKPWPKRIRVGVRVEARPHNMDELFYPAVVVGRDIKTLPHTFQVVYEEDGCFERGLLLSSICQPSRRIVFSSPELVVEDGTIRLWDGERRTVRLLHFAKSLGVYQSGLLLAVDGLTADFSQLPFEVNQAMLLGVYFQRRTTTVVAVLGLGGGAIPACLAHSSEFAQVHAVETLQGVVDCSLQYFYLPSKVQVHVQDAVEFLIECNSTNKLGLGCVIVDVANEDNQCPSPEVIDFFHAHCRNPRADGQVVYVINCILDVSHACWIAAKHFQLPANGTTSCYRVGTTNLVMFLLPSGQQPVSSSEAARLIHTSFPNLSGTMQHIANSLLARADECWVTDLNALLA